MHNARLLPAPDPNLATRIDSPQSSQAEDTPALQIILHGETLFLQGTRIRGAVADGGSTGVRPSKVVHRIARDVQSMNHEIGECNLLVCSEICCASNHSFEISLVDEQRTGGRY